MQNMPGEYYAVVGLGQTGLACVRYFKRLGVACCVIDNREQPSLLGRLQAQHPEVPFFLGHWHEAILACAREIILSPGVSPSLPIFAKLATLGQSIIGDIELFMREVKAPVVGITGSNAKGTVTQGLGIALEAAGKKVLVGGNIGLPVLDLLQEPVPDYYVLELSSFQLETVPSLDLVCGVILNISQDHLDRHKTMQNYIQAKQRIYEASTTWVINREDSLATPTLNAQNRNRISFGLSVPQAGEFGLRYQDGMTYLAFGDKCLAAASEFSLKGLHNAGNLLAILSLAYALGEAPWPLLASLKKYTGLPYRCQWVRNLDGVDWYNDSKATNVGASCAALVGLSQLSKGKIIWLAGGQGKGADFTPLEQAARDRVRVAILFGEDAVLLHHSLSSHVTSIIVDDLSAALGLARSSAHAGDIVLLSPACASFDMFNNYEHRGAVFEEMVLELV